MIKPPIDSKVAVKAVVDGAAPILAAGTRKSSLNTMVGMPNGMRPVVNSKMLAAQ